MTWYPTPTPRLWIGDLHGEPGFPCYAEAIQSPLPTIQVGDFGQGFGTPPPRRAKDRYIRGNHDDPTLCRADPHWIPDGTLDNGVLYVGGAASRDRANRVEGRDWWRDEEIDLANWDSILTRHHTHRPRVVVSHDCPESIRDTLFPGHADERATRTRQGLQAMLELHDPKSWIFGHWHESRDTVINGTRYIALGINETRELNI